MIVDFTIENFRSIKDETIFSMHASSSSKHLLNIISFYSNSEIGIHKTSGIYGANASGKSNVLKAFAALKYIVYRTGSLTEDEAIRSYQPFMLSESNKNSPVKFEIEFINTDNLRYIYRVVYDKFSIIEESLDFYPTSSKANIFNRKKTDTWKTISFGNHYKGGIRRLPFFKNNSYLSKAGENAGTPESIRSVFKFFHSNLNYLDNSSDIRIKEFYKKDALVRDTSSFLSLIDTGISDILIEENDISKIPFPDDIPEEIKNEIIEDTSHSYKFGHISESNQIEYFRKHDESLGTQKLFSLVPLILLTFKSGEVLIVDEIESSLHPHIAELIIKLFNDPLVNTKNAQLIFSTHNIQLMDSSILRRDQIWLTQKLNGITSLYSLDDFDKKVIKPNSPYSRWYDDGRFGGIPSINYGALSDLLRPVD
jgi:AAA15 family ATPase/GTPase